MDAEHHHLAEEDMRQEGAAAYIVEELKWKNEQMSRIREKKGATHEASGP